MKIKIKINNTSTVNSISNYWTNDDFVQLLEDFDYPDAEKASKENLEELLLMAITDFEPNEAAAIILAYKLGDSLNEGQIQQISNDMLLDKIAEEYPDISLHATLFHINQLLFKAFNGKFPSINATQIDCSLILPEHEQDTAFTKENVLVFLDKGLSDSNLIKRLFGEQMLGNNPFPEAENILWEMKKSTAHDYSILTSEYWISKDDFISNEFDAIFEKEDDLKEA